MKIKYDEVVVKIKMPWRVVNNMLHTLHYASYEWWSARAVNADLIDSFTAMELEDLVFYECDEEETKHVLTHAKCVSAIEKMANEAPLAFNDIITENDDVNTADLFLQFALLGKETYA